MIVCGATSRHATCADLPCAIVTSIWRSNVTICSALNLFFPITKLLSKMVSIKPLGTKSAVSSSSLGYKPRALQAFNAFLPLLDQAMPMH